MKAVKVYKHDGSEAGTIELPDDIFGIEPSTTALYQVIKTYLANNRQGNASSKTRSEVDVTKSKPFRQKGTGKARAGSANSPIWKGGGVAFGPKPREYNHKVNRKVKSLGMKSAYSIKANEDNIYILEDFELQGPKTKTVTGVLKNLGLNGKKIMMLVHGKDEVLVKSVRNIPYFNLQMAENANAYELMNSDVLIFTRASVERVKEFFHNEKQ